MTPSNDKHEAWFVYLVECSDKSLYCGITKNLDDRVAQHNGEKPGGARYTRGRRPVRLVASSPCPDKSTALKEECAVKRKSRGEKISYLKQLAPVNATCADATVH
ncbi:MAG: GIY-YIG nuclease family protein [Desulfovibrio sp.]|nr:GIY-YIG nuclease family protein [Desulfovibrio sp.]